ncbi:MAG: hypothetical protein IJO97_02710 [Lachnospiraceae bacterium]|nr:hypothetical protein [Lachnospiraceae bacterium]
MKKIAALLVCVMSVGLLGGCGNSFDASAYTKAVLDNAYKNDSTGFVELEVGTAEESAEVYQEGLDAVVDSWLTAYEITDDYEADFEAIFADILSNVKYTVGEAEKQDDDSFIVTVTYEQMNVFAPAIEAYTTTVTELTAAWVEAAAAGEEIPTEDEMVAELVIALEDNLKNSLANVTYDEAATTTIRIELVDNVYTPNTDDLATFESVIFDYEEMEEVVY